MSESINRMAMQRRLRERQPATKIPFWMWMIVGGMIMVFIAVVFSH
jgi:hypothetical protein